MRCSRIRRNAPSSTVVATRMPAWADSGREDSAALDSTSPTSLTPCSVVEPPSVVADVGHAHGPGEVRTPWCGCA